MAQQLPGHLTASILKRYAIVDESMLLEAGARLSELYGANSSRRSNTEVLERRND